MIHIGGLTVKQKTSEFIEREQGNPGIRPRVAEISRFARHESKTDMELITAEPLAQTDSSVTDGHHPAAGLTKQSRFEALAAELFACSNASPKKLCKIIERDVALRAEVIALANSFIFSFGRPVRSLAQAVACLGYARCRQLVANKLGVEHSEGMEPEQSDRPKSDSNSSRRLPGVRPYRKERLSSLYPPKNRGPRPHFLSTEPGRT
jgi:hypothetical protein